MLLPIARTEDTLESNSFFSFFELIVVTTGFPFFMLLANIIKNDNGDPPLSSYEIGIIAAIELALLFHVVRHPSFKTEFQRLLEMSTQIAPKRSDEPIYLLEGIVPMTLRDRQRQRIVYIYPDNDQRPVLRI